MWLNANKHSGQGSSCDRDSCEPVKGRDSFEPDELEWLLACSNIRVHIIAIIHEYLTHP